MKIVSILCGLFLLTFSAAAQNNGVAANGSFQFAVPGASGTIQFDARVQGSQRGNMTFTANAEISNEDVDGEGGSSSPVSTASMTVSFDCVRITGNRATMSGLVTSSTLPAWVGRRGLLVVEDNGQGSNATGPDRFSWGLYRTNANSWIPSDFEVPGDNGALLSWFVSDFDRPSDPLLPSSQFTAPTSVDCQSFAFELYAFEEVAQGGGNIQVKP